MACPVPCSKWGDAARVVNLNGKRKVFHTSQSTSPCLRTVSSNAAGGFSYDCRNLSSREARGVALAHGAFYDSGLFAVPARFYARLWLHPTCFWVCIISERKLERTWRIRSDIPVGWVTRGDGVRFRVLRFLGRGMEGIP